MSINVIYTLQGWYNITYNIIYIIMIIIIVYNNNLISNYIYYIYIVVCYHVGGISRFIEL